MSNESERSFAFFEVDGELRGITSKWNPKVFSLIHRDVFEIFEQPNSACLNQKGCADSLLFSGRWFRKVLVLLGR
jgi:hypothetical protein